MSVLSGKSPFAALLAVAIALGCGSLISAPAHAEPWCHEIVGPVGPNGEPGEEVHLCENAPIPDPSHFTAIYFDAATSSVGSSWGYDSKAGADQRALAECRANGGHNCMPAAWGQHRCLALATSTNGAWQAEVGHYPETAQASAIAKCRANGGAGCHILVHPCSED
jgi:hypothetical protein